MAPWRICACVEWWDCASGRGALHTFFCPIINHIGRISCQVRSDVSEGQENGLHVVPLASALVKSLTELDLRWAFLAVQMPSWFFLLCVNAAQRQLKCPNYHHQMTIGIKTHRMDGFQRKRSGSVRPALALALHRDGAGRWPLHACLLVRAQGPTW